MECVEASKQKPHKAWLCGRTSKAGCLCQCLAASGPKTTTYLDKTLSNVSMLLPTTPPTPSPDRDRAMSSSERACTRDAMLRATPEGMERGWSVRCQVSSATCHSNKWCRIQKYRVSFSSSCHCETTPGAWNSIAELRPSFFISCASKSMSWGNGSVGTSGYFPVTRCN